MIRYSGMEAKESSNNSRQLPAGPYVCKVLNVRIEGKEPDQRLAVMIDISEGLYAGYWTTKYNAQKERGSNYDIKYKGIIRLRIPNPDNKNAQYPESDMRRFNDMIARFQNSNPGVELYSADGFDETRLKGLTVGVSVQEDSFNGAVFTRPVRFENADDVRNGLVKVMEPRKRDDENPTSGPMTDQQTGMAVVNTEKLPWDANDRPW